MAKKADPELTTEPALDEPQFEVIPVPVFEQEPAEKPRYYVLGGDLVAQTDDGELRLPLRVPFRLVGDLVERTPREQLYKVLRDRQRPRGWRFWRPRSDMVQRIENLDHIDSNEVVRKFWQALGEKEQARLGESLRSIDSSRSTEQH